MRFALKSLFLKMRLNITNSNLIERNSRLRRFPNTRNSRFTHLLFLTFISAMLYFSTGAAEAATREYWIAAEKVEWNYAPSGQNLIRPEMGFGCVGQSTCLVKNIATFNIPMTPIQSELNNLNGLGILGPQFACC